MGLASIFATTQLNAQDTDSASKPKPKQWFEKLSIRGYTQVRYSNLLSTNENLQCSSCDKAIGSKAGFTIRRARIVLSGPVSDRVSIYIQPDLATDISGKLNALQLRDAYFDLALDKDKEFRMRFGQSKIPYGWDNLQSSSNRLSLDRMDALNSAVPNERDLGVQFMYTPKKVQKLFKTISDAGLKGTGDYGMVAVAAFNGQGANTAEANGNMHSAVRFAYPFAINNGQIFEVGLQGYSGRYVMTSVSSGITTDLERDDYRIAGTFVMYPQPFGLQAEWNVGRGPQFDPGTSSIQNKSLSGGYVQTMYRAVAGEHVIIPFVKAQQYKGGKKAELDARKYDVKEMEIGIEWLPMKAFEFTAMYTIADRTYEDLANPVNRQKGNFLRLQAQFNY